MNRIKIHSLFTSACAEEQVRVSGWVRTRRDSKEFSFIEINDGSCLKNLQIVADHSLFNYGDVQKLTTGSAVSVSGRFVTSLGKGQDWELQASEINIINLAPESYPLQKKRHSDEFLRTLAHLRPRTNKYGAVFRIRSEMSYAIHTFFKERGFFYIHTPIITGSDCEGAGEMFRVTTLDLSKMASERVKFDASQDFFGKDANLTVSGQLSAEMFSLALGDVYTFGPTFRAEDSNTRRHAAEFWMVEPEMAFCDLSGNMTVGEELIRYLIDHALLNCPEDMALLGKYVDKTLLETLDHIVSSEFIRLPYDEAVEILKASPHTFEYPVETGVDLQSEHEKYLTEVYFNKPVILYNYPKTIKPFYMRLNEDQRTVAAMDILVPGIGEIIGGSQREERLDVLEARMDEMGLAKDNYWWYLDSRRYGSVPHSGFGMGFERLIMMITGVSNIRDVIPFPRTPGTIDF